MGVGYPQTSPMRPRDVLAENLKKLMAASSRLSTFPQITKAGGGANGTLDRIRRKSIATGVDNLEPLAQVYGLQPWQLLVPTLTATQTADGEAAISGTPEWPFSVVPLGRFLALTPQQRGFVEARLLQAIEDCESVASDVPQRKATDEHVGITYALQPGSVGKGDLAAVKPGKVRTPTPALDRLDERLRRGGSDERETHQRTGKRGRNAKP